ncbi:MAG: hypothetical protein ABI533_03240 [Betaproteobacteria bacterium]
MSRPFATAGLLLGVTVVLAGCHGMERHRHDMGDARNAVRVPHEHKGANCKGPGVCDVEIRFACLSKPSSPTRTQCEVYAYPEVVAVDREQNIKFTIQQNTGIEFEADGIVFDSSYISCPQNQAGKTNLVCHVGIPTGTRPDFYKYSIHVKGFDVVDPWVVNY